MKLEVADLVISFGSRTISRVDSLSIGAGQILGLVGESGSGKSMTATAIIGLAERLGATVAGHVYLDGVDILAYSDSEWRAIRGRRIAMIFQSPSLAFNPVMRVGDVFVRALRLHGEQKRDRARARAEEAIAALALVPGVLDRYPGELSGGQLQRVGIALAVALRAEVLLADEPTSALDVTVQAELLDLLREMARTYSVAVLLISHDLAVVSEVADQVAVMKSGRIVEMGPAAGVLSSPANDYTKQLIAAVPTLASSHAAESGSA